MKRNQSIDLVKYIFANMIILIHAQIFLDTNYTLYSITSQGIARLAVPFFFICSGYFFTKKVVLNKETNSYIKHLLKILFVFLLLELFIYAIQIIPLVINGRGIYVIWRMISVGFAG